MHSIFASQVVPSDVLPQFCCSVLLDTNLFVIVEMFNVAVHLDRIMDIILFSGLTNPLYFL